MAICLDSCGASSSMVGVPKQSISFIQGIGIGAHARVAALWVPGDRIPRVCASQPQLFSCLLHKGTCELESEFQSCE